jgi:hypothetical protein
MIVERVTLIAAFFVRTVLVVDEPSAPQAETRRPRVSKTAARRVNTPKA